MSEEELYRFVCESESMRFLDREASAALEAVLQARPAYEPFLKERARRDLIQGTRSRLNRLYLNAIASRISRAAQRIEPLSMGNLRKVDPSTLMQADEAVARELGPDPARGLREALPCLCEFEAKILRYAIESQTELLDNVFRCRELISTRFFGGKDITAIESLTGMGGDAHRHGRSVVGVRTDAGTFYHKPHDCRLDAMYHELVARFFPDCTVAADCIPCDGYGFVTELVPAPMEDVAKVRDYYRYFGMLAALFHGIGATDMHFENILPCADRPAVVDLETMMTPKWRREAERDGVRPRVESAQAQALAHSVRRTSIMPAYVMTLGIASPLYPTSRSQGHLPFIGDVRYSVEGYEDDFIEGFREGYERVLSNREAIGALLRNRGDAVIRILIHNTAYFDYLQGQLYAEENLRSHEAQRMVLDRLEVPYRLNGRGLDRAVLDHEKACLLEGDIPYFCATLNGKALCGASPDECLREHALEFSAQERSLFFLDRLNDRELSFETGLIRHDLSSVPLAEPKASSAHPLVLDLPDKTLIESVQVDICGKLRDGMLRTPDGSALWLSALPSLMAESRVCDVSQFSADVGRYVACLKRFGCAQGLDGIAEALAGHSLTCIDGMLSRWERESGETLRNRLSLDGRFGVASIVSACDAMAVARIPGAEETFHRLLRLLWKENLAEAERTDGLEDFLVSIDGSRMAHPCVTALVRACGERLLQVQPRDPKSVIATASRANAFSIAGRATGLRRFFDAADEALLALRERYAERVVGWPDEKAVWPWLAPRGTQAAWLCLCALNAREALAGHDARMRAEELLCLSLDSLMAEERIWPNDSLNHGNALAAHALIQAARELGDGCYLMRAGQILAAMLDRARQKGTFTVCPEGIRSFFDVSFTCGTTGIGAVAAAWYAKSAKGNRI